MASIGCAKRVVRLVMAVVARINSILLALALVRTVESRVRVVARAETTVVPTIIGSGWGAFVVVITIRPFITCPITIISGVFAVSTPRDGLTIC